MGPERNKQVVRNFMQSFNDRDRPSMRALLADDVTYGGLDAEKFLDVEFAWCELFRDLQIRIDDMIAEDDRVAFRWTFIGTHTARAASGGPLTPVGHADAISALLTEVEPSGASVEIPGIAVGKLKGGKIVQWWGEWRSLSLYEQLGARLVVNGNSPRRLSNSPHLQPGRQTRQIDDSRLTWCWRRAAGGCQVHVARPVSGITRTRSQAELEDRGDRASVEMLSARSRTILTPPLTPPPMDQCGPRWTELANGRCH